MNSTPICFRCHKIPAELEEYLDRMEVDADFYADVNDLVRRDEGTYNHETGTFCCTECYIAIGCPSSPTGWKAPAA